MAGVSAGVASGFPLPSLGLASGLPWAFLGFSLRFPRAFLRLSLGFPRACLGLASGLPRTYLGLYADCPRAFLRLSSGFPTPTTVLTHLQPHPDPTLHCHFLGSGHDASDEVQNTTCKHVHVTPKNTLANVCMPKKAFPNTHACSVIWMRSALSLLHCRHVTSI